MEMIKLLEDLVKMDSSTKTGANEAVAFCADWLKKRNVHSEILETRGSHMLVAEVGKGDKTIILNGHVDVVPGTPEQFTPLIQDGKMYGRGTADMKAGVAAMMCLAAEMANDEASQNCKIQLQIVSDEETGSHCSRYLADQGYHGDFVICGEPTQLGIGLQSKGVLYLDAIVMGKPAHGSRPWEGDNAILKAFRIYQQILELPFAKEKSAMYEFPSIDLPIIEGGTVMNQVPAVCKMSLNVRFLPEQSPEEIVKQIESVTDGDVVVTGKGDAIATKQDDPYVEALKTACEEKLSPEQVRLFGQHGSSDGKHFAKYGIPAVEFGPSGDGWHGDSEYVDIESVKTYKDILGTLVSTIAFR